MLNKINPTQTPAWNKLIQHYDQVKELQMKDLFKEDGKRFEKFSIQFEDLLVDFSKNRITEQTLELLFELAEDCGLANGMDHFFNGTKINETENRAVLHTALRNFSDREVVVDGENVMPSVRKVLNQIQSFTNRLHHGEVKGYTGKVITDVVNIGIGGSDLGLVMVTEALRPYWKPGIEAHYISNVDSTHAAEVLKKLSPETTLFIICSKSFTTQETMTNAYSARKWFLESAVEEEYVKQHFLAVSTNEQGVKQFGIAPENQFVFWDWVGGRFSLSSSVGLIIASTIGYANFENLLKGMHSMDEHFRVTPIRQNLPAILAMIGIWYTNFFGAASEVILPYDQYLHRFSDHFQQTNMESNGKSIDRSGQRVDYSTGPIIWGKPGTNGQHAFYQLIHQGTQLMPCDFIASAISHNPMGDHHPILLSNYFAQTEALMKGRTKEEVLAALQASGKSASEIDFLLPFKVFEGNKPSNSILIKKLTPYTLGQLIALYEHKIFVQGLIWNVYSFDQWGVQLGKLLANKILPELKGDAEITQHDASTNGLINAYKTMRDA